MLWRGVKKNQTCLEGSLKSDQYVSWCVFSWNVQELLQADLDGQSFYFSGNFLTVHHKTKVAFQMIFYIFQEPCLGSMIRLQFNSCRGCKMYYSEGR